MVEAWTLAIASAYSYEIRSPLLVSVGYSRCGDRVPFEHFPSSYTPYYYKKLITSLPLPSRGGEGLHDRECYSGLEKFRAPPSTLSEKISRSVNHCVRVSWLTIVGGYIEGSDRRGRRRRWGSGWIRGPCGVQTLVVIEGLEGSSIGL